MGFCIIRESECQVSPLVAGHAVGNVAALAKESSFTRNVDFAGRFVYDDSGCEVFNFGKYKGESVAVVLHRDPGYYGWMMNGDFPLNTKQVLTRIKLREFNK